MVFNEIPGLSKRFGVACWEPSKAVDENRLRAAKIEISQKKVLRVNQRGELKVQKCWGGD